MNKYIVLVTPLSTKSHLGNLYQNDVVSSLDRMVMEAEDIEATVKQWLDNRKPLSCKDYDLRLTRVDDGFKGAIFKGNSPLLRIRIIQIRGRLI